MKGLSCRLLCNRMNVNERKSIVNVTISGGISMNIVQAHCSVNSVDRIIVSIIQYRVIITLSDFVCKRYFLKACSSIVSMFSLQRLFSFYYRLLFE